MDHKFIRNLLEDLQYGAVSQIFINDHKRFINKKNNHTSITNHRSASVYFHNWYDSSYNDIRRSILFGPLGKMKIQYENSRTIEVCINKFPLNKRELMTAAKIFRHTQKETDISDNEVDDE